MNDCADGRAFGELNLARLADERAYDFLAIAERVDFGIADKFFFDTIFAHLGNWP